LQLLLLQLLLLLLQLLLLMMRAPTATPALPRASSWRQMTWAAAAAAGLCSTLLLLLPPHQRHRLLTPSCPPPYRRLQAAAAARLPREACHWPWAARCGGRAARPRQARARLRYHSTVAKCFAVCGWCPPAPSPTALAALPVRWPPRCSCCCSVDCCCCCSAGCCCCCCCSVCCCSGSPTPHRARRGEAPPWPRSLESPTSHPWTSELQAANLASWDGASTHSRRCRQRRAAAPESTCLGSSNLLQIGWGFVGVQHLGRWPSAHSAYPARPSTFRAAGYRGLGRQPQRPRGMCTERHVQRRSVHTQLHSAPVPSATLRTESANGKGQEASRPARLAARVNLRPEPYPRPSFFCVFLCNPTFDLGPKP